MSKDLRNRVILIGILVGLFVFSLIPLASAEAATFSETYPANGATVTSGRNQTINVKVNDTVNLDKNSVTVLVNGKTEPFSFGFKELGYYENEDYQEGWVVTGYVYNEGYVSLRPAVLADGLTTVTVSIKDINGLESSNTWNFTVKQIPTISDLKPVKPYGMLWTLVKTSTTVSAKIEDNGSISQVKMTINGAEVPAVFDSSTGIISYPMSQLTSGTMYNISLVVTDAYGLSTNGQWNFYSEYLQDSGVTYACKDCHAGASSTSTPTHTMNNCALCHSRGPVGDCDTCHTEQHGYDLLDNHNCTECHQAKYPEIPIHPADNNALHNTTTDMSLCGKCHQAALNTEHLQHEDSTGKPLNCNTCHSNTIATVQQAISNKQMNCDACHSQLDHDALHENTVLDDKCTTCHINNLSKEHLANSKTQTEQLSCGACHNSTDPAIKVAIRTGEQNCTACHSQGHNMSFAEKVPADIPLYAGFQWTSPSKAGIWNGEPWMPAEYVADGKLVLSSRRKDVTGDQIWNFYQNELTVKGWTVASGTPASGSNNYSVKFTKNNRQLELLFFDGAVPGGTNQAESGGYRIQIIYK